MTLIKVKSRGTDNVSGRRNLVINGDMRIAQRGTSATGITNNGSHFLVDRFKTVINSSYTSTIQQVADAPDGFIYSLKHTFTTATSSPGSGDYNVLDTNLEKQNLYSTGNGTSWAGSITLSFWVKSSITGTFAFALQSFGSSRRSNVLSYTISSANTWEKKVITTTADTTANTNGANGAGLGLRFALGSGSSYEASNATTGWQTADYFGFNGATYPAGTTNATWQITGVQFEVGDSASDFEHRSFGEELSLCHRYYYEISSNTHDGYEYPMFAAHAWNSSAINVCIKLPVVMRTSPTLTFNNGSGWWRFYRNNGNDPFDTMQADGGGSHSIDMQSSGGISATQGDAGRLQVRMGGGANAAIKCSAEL
jgi:hypothetical protein